MPKANDNQPLGRKFLELSAVSAYGTWLVLVLFPISIAGVSLVVDESRSTQALMLSSIAMGTIAASYVIRFYLVRNTASLRTKVLEADSRETAIRLISGGLWWWLVTLILAIAVVLSHNPV